MSFPRSVLSVAIPALALSAAALGQSSLGTVQFPGSSVAGVGDVNGDGYDDFVAGEPHAFTFFNGRAVVFSGKDHSILYQFVGGARDLLGTSVAGPGDLDGDGVPDIAVGAVQYYSDFTQAKGYIRLYSGKTGAPIWTASGLGAKEYLGTSLAVVGDIDHDGKTDLLAGSNFHLVRVISGATGTILSTISYSVFSFGWSVAAAGDVNQDGTPDFLVGAPTTTGGIVTLYSGATSQPLRMWLGTNGNEQIGYGLAGGVDWSGDGVPDIVLGAPGSDVAGPHFGAVIVRSGADDSIVRTYLGSATNTQFGYRVAVIGDVDEDGSIDLLASEMNASSATGFGAAHVLSGASAQRICSVEGPLGTPANSFGAAIAAGGDLNNDGVDDIIVSSYVTQPGGAIYLVSPIVVGATPYGTGKAGCDGVETMLGNSVPHVGNAAFAVNCGDTPMNGAGFLLISATQDLAGTPALGIVLHVGLGGAILALPVTSNATGHAVMPLPIPADASLAGLSAYLQTIWAWSPSVCSPSSTGLSSSRGLALTIQ